MASIVPEPADADGNAVDGKSDSKNRSGASGSGMDAAGVRSLGIGYTQMETKLMDASILDFKRARTGDKPEVITYVEYVAAVRVQKMFRCWLAQSRGALSTVGVSTLPKIRCQILGHFSKTREHSPLG